MVQVEHRGRFATGCLNCRQRKIKCDEARPSCNRCLKGRWTCPGYKALADLTFRNQNVVVARIAHKQQAESIGTSTFQAYAPSHSLVPKPHSSSKSLNVDLENVARAYFLSCHVVVGSGTLPRGQYEFLSDFLSNQQYIDPALHHSLNAAAFSAFGNSHNSAKMLQNSRVECNLAIQAVNIALQSPEAAAKDSTMIAAMLLWTFEALTFTSQQDEKGCIGQLTGGLALLMIRGPKQLDTRLGLQIFLQAYFLVVSTCIMKDHALPPGSSDVRTFVQPYVDAGDCAWRILDIMARFADLLDALKDRSRQDLIPIATKLDDDFQAVSSCMPPHWRYQTFHCSDPALVYSTMALITYTMMLGSSGTGTTYDSAASVYNR